LLRYLSSRLGIDGLQYAQEPTPVADGWETYIYHFRLQEDGSLPPEFRGPLTLRLLAGPRGVPQGRQAFEAQRYVRRLGYPAAAPVCWEEACEILGGPFLIMERVPGPTLLQRLLDRPWTVLVAGRRMAELQTWLHRLPVEGFPAPPEPLLERSLDRIEKVIRQCGLDGLTPGLEWLSAHRPAPPAAPCIVHLDFHPLNLICRPGQPAAVLDWDSADVGDPHADVATTLVLLRCAPNEGKNLWERTAVAVGRQLLRDLYLRACRARTALEDDKLTYYEALAALRRLTRYERFLTAGPQVLGLKPSLTRHLGRAHLEALCRHFRHLTGVRVHLDGEP
jgi:aminoglycoside phosphotransferase (APT) family kinase protein